jgi:hypothetical protein
MQGLLQASHLRDELTLLALMIVGALVYGGMILALFGREWLAVLNRRRGRAPGGV